MATHDPTGGARASPALEVAALALVLAAALSGCAAGGQGDAAGDGAGQPLDGVDVRATATTGVLRGVVVDEAIRPLAGVEVTLSSPSGPRVQTTGPSGGFGFDGLAPGTYFVNAHLFGYADAQGSAEVEAGVEDPPLVKLALQRIAGLVAFVESFVWDGFLECGSQSILFYANLCSLPNFSSSLTCSATQGGQPPVPPLVPVCLGNVTNDRYLIGLELASNLTVVQSEMVWQSTQTLGDSLELRHYAGNRQEFEAQLINSTLNATMGPSPVIVVDTTEDLEDAGVGLGNLLILGAYPGYGGEGAGATAQQRFTVYVNAFHGYLPPDGWTFTATGEVPPPR